MQQLSPEQAVVAEHRKLLLQHVIDKHFAGSRQAFATAIGRSISQVGHWLYAWGNKHRKNIGEELARAIEQACGLPQNFMLVPSREHLTREQQAYLDTFATTMEKGGTVHNLEVAETVRIKDVVQRVPLQHRPRGRKVFLIGKERVSEFLAGARDEAHSMSLSSGYAPAMTDDADAFLIRVEGTSMAPRFHPGELALVEPNTEPDVEDDVLVQLKTGELKLGRLLSRKGGVKLGSYADSGSEFFLPEQVERVAYVAHALPARRLKQLAPQLG